MAEKANTQHEAMEAQTVLHIGQGTKSLLHAGDRANCVCEGKEARWNVGCGCYRPKGHEAVILFDLPCKSKLINTVYMVESDLSTMKRKLLEATDLHRKAVCLPHAQGFAIFPLLHIFKD